MCHERGHKFFPMAGGGSERIMKMSVVIPTCQRPVLLMRCIEALCNQIFPKEEFEIIVVSDGPDQKTTDALSSLSYAGKPLIRFISLQEKGGPAAARNLGWRVAASRLIAFTDDDCIPDAKWLLTFWNAFLRSAGNKAAFTGKTSVPIPPVPTDYERNIAQLETAEFITANCACTKAALEKVGGFDEQFTMAWREDSDLQFKFLELGIPIINVRSAIVTHPVRKAPWGISIKEEKKGIFNALLYKKFPSLYKKRIQPTPPWHYYIIFGCIFLFLIGILASAPILSLMAFMGWMLLTGWFAFKRLHKTSHSLSHVAEMLVTSAIIPILSLYWRIYGALKYKVMLIP
jgi:GT2 family glycosyltransferase